jgi:NAD(P)H-hydrate epimerase
MNTTRILTSAQMRWADSATIEAGISGAELMDRAGLAVAHAVQMHMSDYGRVVIVAGPGNNGGDGFAAAIYLRRSKIPVTVVTLVPFDSIKGDAREFADQAVEEGVKIREACGDNASELDRWLVRAVMIVDAIFGTGLSRELDGEIAAAIAKINQIGRPVLSVDIASGLDADSGIVLGAAVSADLTLPIAASKWGHWLAEGRDYSGKILAAAAIGVTESTLHESWRAVQGCLIGCQESCFNSACLVDDDFLDVVFPERPRISHKGNFGHIWVFGGSTGYTGAPGLAARGAFAAGAGRVSIVCPDTVWPVIAASNPETMVHPESSAPWQEADSIVAGPGWGLNQQALLTTLLEGDKPLVLDADALNMIADSNVLQEKLTQRAAMTVITPHPGEAARLLNDSVAEIQRDRKRSILRMTRKFACWVVLKGNETLIASPKGDIYLNPFGSPRLAVAGSGDVLAGMIGTQLASMEGREINTGVLISATVALHGMAGEQGDWFLVSELAKAVAALRQNIEGGGKTGNDQR